MNKVEITVSSHELLTKLKAVGKVISQSSINPMHDYFLFEVENNNLKLTASNAEGNITTSCEVTVSGEARFLIESKLLLNGLKELSEQPITLTVTFDETVHVILKHESGHYFLQALDADNFPVIAQDVETTEIILNSKTFVSGIKATLPFAGNDELRPIMNSIFVEFKNNQLNFTATNSSMMSVKEFFNQQHDDFSFILPVKISKILSEMFFDENITFNIGTRNVSIASRDTYIVYRLVEGNYPNYRSVIPKSNDKILIAATKDIAGALRRASLFANQSSSLVMLTIAPKHLVISGKDIDFQISAEETVKCEWNSNESLVIGFKSTFLHQCINAVENSDIRLTFSSPERACLLSPDEQDENSSLTILLMPMQINV